MKVIIILIAVMALMLVPGTVSADRMQINQIFAPMPDFTQAPVQVICLDNLPQFAGNGQEYTVRVSTGQSLQVDQGTFENMSTGAWYIFDNPLPLTNGEYLAQGYTLIRPAPSTEQIKTDIAVRGPITDTYVCMEQ